MMVANASMASVILVNYNGRAFLDRCLHALSCQTYAPLEVIMVDNNSTDGSVAHVEARWGHFVRLVKSAKNLGFAAGNNLGFQQARGEYLLPLNCDTEVSPGWVEALARCANTQPDVGMCASKVLLYTSPERVDSAGLSIFRDGYSLARGRAALAADHYKAIEEVLVPSACACLYKRAMLEDVGDFDESFFAYFEDTDLGLRARLRGWQCLFTPEATVKHAGSGSFGLYSPRRVYLMERNRLWVALKLFPLPWVLGNPLFTVERYLHQVRHVSARHTAVGQFMAQWPLPKIMMLLLKANLDAARAFGAVARGRRVIQSRRVISESDRQSWFTRFGLSAAAVADYRAEYAPHG